jgi:kumamolisin
MFVTAGIAHGQSMMTRHTRLEVTSGRVKFVNRLPGTQILRLDIVLPLRDQAGLDSFLKEVYDPTSPIYRHFLTVPEFTERFGPTQEDYDALVAFAKGRGFNVVGGSRDGMDVQVEGSVTVIEAAFNVAMGIYQHPTENRNFYAPDREPSVAVGFPLWHISGLDNFSIPRPALVHRQSGARPAATVGSGPSASFLGSDMRAAYYGGSLTGTGQNIGLFEYEGYDIADLNTYYTNAKQTNLSSLVKGVSTDGTSLSCVYPSCDDTEQTLDMTQALGMAPGITALYVYVGSTDTAILSSITSHAPLPAQIGCSWGWSPADPSTDDPYYQRMASQGQNFFVAAGDSDKWTRSNYPYPAEDANVVTVGGTDLSTSSAGGAWASETAWSGYSGGGISPDNIPIPSWQKLSGVINSSNGGSTSYRNGPDVAANANFTFYVCADQTTCTANEYGGTSFAAPMWAGYLALVNQQAVANGNAVLGFINPLIYPMGVSAQANYFHDITSGTNGYPAVAGYDLVTGWGSPNGAGLLNALAGTSSSPNFSLSASPGSVSVVQGNNGTSTITASISGGFNSAIGLSASGQPSGVTVSFSPTSIAAPGSGTSTMTMAVASGTATGTYTITVTGSGGGLTRTTTVSLTVTAAGGSPDFTIGASPTSLTVNRGSSGNVTITTKVSGGFSSSIALSASGLPSGVSVTFTPSSIPAPGGGTSTMRITVSRRAGTSTSTITITGTGGGKTHTTTVKLTT